MTDNGTEFLAPIIPSTPLWTTYYLIRPAKKKGTDQKFLRGREREIVNRYDLSMAKPQASN
jgi:hypothetical protein